jgi:hypothetical protein
VSWIHRTPIVLTLVLASTSVLAKIPDPNTSTCTFPESALPCGEPVTIHVTLRDAFMLPVVACSTSVTILVEEGDLRLGQQTTASGFTDGNGDVDLAFPDGILGDATIRFAVECYCYGVVPICESETYGVHCPAATGVGAVGTGPWGWIKAGYR